VLGRDALLLAADDATTQLELLLRLPLANYVSRTRIAHPAPLLSVLQAAQQPCPLSVLENILARQESSRERRRATLAWLLKYDLLRVAQ
jgi:hypothetical protein